MNDAQRTVVIAGAAGGLGTALARRFAREPLRHLVLADIDPAALDDVAAELAPDATIDLIQVDVSDRESVERLVSTVVARHDALDVMINNAGVLSESGRIHNLPVDAWQRCFQVNLMGVVNGMAAAVPEMRRRGGGVIVNTASIAGINPFPYAGPYSATKAAVVSVTKTAALEYARDGIRVNAVCPGTFRTRIHDGLSDEAMRAMADRHPLGLGTAEQIVGAFVYLAGADSSWTTGSAIYVDGGYAAP
jgi:3-oxoacyl-[acyl-carrier protein] reductase